LNFNFNYYCFLTYWIKGGWGNITWWRWNSWKLIGQFVWIASW